MVSFMREETSNHLSYIDVHTIIKIFALPKEKEKGNHPHIFAHIYTERMIEREKDKIITYKILYTKGKKFRDEKEKRGRSEEKKHGN